MSAAARSSDSTASSVSQPTANPQQPTYGDLLEQCFNNGVENVQEYFDGQRKKYLKLDEGMRKLHLSIGLLLLAEVQDKFSTHSEETQERIWLNKVKNRGILAVGSVIYYFHIAESLDEWNGGGTSYKNLFINSLQSEGAGAAFLQFSRYSPRGDHMKGIEISDTVACFRALQLHNISEELRKGEKLGAVLSKYNPFISDFAKQGDERFFISLANLIRRHSTSGLVVSFEGWLRDAWMPLALWNATPNECVQRLEDYRRLLSEQERRVPAERTVAKVKHDIRRFQKRLKDESAD